MRTGGEEGLKDGKATLREKLCFGAGSVTYCVEMTLVLTYLMLFCSDVLHIDVAVIGIVMAVVKVLDAVSDIVITNLADRTDTRWGKYRVWLLNGIPLAVMLFLLFSNPGFLQNDTARIIWICVIYIILVPVLETAVSCPYMAMTVTMSKYPKDRLDFPTPGLWGRRAPRSSYPWRSCRLSSASAVTGKSRAGGSWRLSSEE